MEQDKLFLASVVIRFLGKDSLFIYDSVDASTPEAAKIYFENKFKQLHPTAYACTAHVMKGHDGHQSLAELSRWT